MFVIRHWIKFNKLNFEWSSNLVHYVIINQLVCEEPYEIWSLGSGNPDRFSLYEFKEIMLLNCKEFPEDQPAVNEAKKSWFWNLLKLRPNRNSPCFEDLQKLVADCRYWSREDMIRFCYLIIMCNGLLAVDRREALPLQYATQVMDLDRFEQYPWGELLSMASLGQLKKVGYKQLQQTSYTLKGFVQVLQICFYLAVPQSATSVGISITTEGPPLLRYRGKGSKIPLDEVFFGTNVTVTLRQMAEFKDRMMHTFRGYSDSEDLKIDKLITGGGEMVDWSKLPEELLPMIAVRIYLSSNSYVSVAYAKLGSPSISSDYNPFPPRPFIHFNLLIVNVDTNLNLGAFLSQAAFYHVTLSSSPRKGWLIKSDEDVNSKKLHLVNPLSRFELPQCGQSINLLGVTLLEIREAYEVQNQRNIKESTGFKRVVLVTVAGGDRLVLGIGFDWSGDIWTRLHDQVAQFSDIIVHNRLTYALDSHGVVCEAARQAIWLQGLLEEVIGSSCEKTVIMIDNQSAIALTKNPVFHGMSKHIHTRYHFIRECVENGQIEVKHVPGNEQKADVLTKALGRLKFKEMRV